MASDVNFGFTSRFSLTDFFSVLIYLSLWLRLASLW